MGYILLGFVFTILNFDFTLGVMKIGLIPDFIGWALILKGIFELERIEELYEIDNIKTVGIIVTVYSTIWYIMDLTGITASISGMAFFNIALLIVDFVLMLLKSYVLLGIFKKIFEQLEAITMANLYSVPLSMVYMVIVALNICVYLMSIFGAFVAGAAFVAVGVFVLNIAVLVMLILAWRNYNHG